MSAVDTANAFAKDFMTSLVSGGEPVGFANDTAMIVTESGESRVFTDVQQYHAAVRGFLGESSVQVAQVIAAPGPSRNVTLTIDAAAGDDRHTRTVVFSTVLAEAETDVYFVASQTATFGDVMFCEPAPVETAPAAVVAEEPAAPAAVEEPVAEEPEKEAPVEEASESSEAAEPTPPPTPVAEPPKAAAKPQKTAEKPVEKPAEKAAPAAPKAKGWAAIVANNNTQPPAPMKKPATPPPAPEEPVAPARKEPAKAPARKEPVRPKKAVAESAIVFKVGAEVSNDDIVGSLPVKLRDTVFELRNKSSEPEKGRRVWVEFTVAGAMEAINAAGGLELNGESVKVELPRKK